jgi:hypothetical protein
MPSKNRTHLVSFVSLIGLAVIAAAPASAQRMGTPSSVTGGGNTVLPSLERTNPQLFYQEAVKALQAKDFRGAAAALKEAMKDLLGKLPGSRRHIRSDRHHRQRAAGRGVRRMTAQP